MRKVGVLSGFYLQRAKGHTFSHSRALTTTP